VPNTLVNTELSLEFFKKNFTPDFIQENVEKITFCGDDGDPIYAHDLIEVIEYIKSVKPVKFVIVTNGSYKKTEWWTRLGSVLDHNDHIHFSIDGWHQESNEQYRVNSDWDSIIQGITTLRGSSHVYMTWAAIAFSFNQDKIADMKLLAKDLGFDQFQLTLSTKFHKVYNMYPKDDLLQPKDELISTTHRFQRVITHFNERRESVLGAKTNLKLYNQAKTFGEVIPLCGIGNKGLFVNSQGHLFPCCWVANRYTHNNEWTEVSKNQFDLNKRSLKEVLNDSYWSEEFEIFSRAECRTKCNKAVVNQQYATEW
jgi:MoaA/NifB/PqqE/SkfB family radical SAM enzyme